ncbi:hypothetical protein ABW02_15245 [Niallia circulans]|uniref:Endonuclease/exonuclease/phosphatase domain-containing protein n=1 Tax=Niallia circulans TaxID=1397 RepID=A0A0J1IHW0_NIACI|nr:endonuclease/exonuclease/phosphatase family protein [Niallia circulans]KLV25522.1 hypothetical protein ABW02_15245 [Niallia circulans]
MNTINIRTLNVNWFRKKISDPYYDQKDCDIDAYTNIVKNIKDFLKSKVNSVVFLQEVPYKMKQDREWVECDYHKKLIKDFPRDKYEIAENISNYITRCTIAIFKKGTFNKAKNYKPCNNRTIGLTLDNDITLLGVHMPTKFKKDDQNDYMWSELIEYSSNMVREKRKLIIVGDFNSYIGCLDGNTEGRFIELCRVAKDIVSDDTPTYIGQTPIDHIFLNFDSKQDYEVYIEEDWNWSDHKFLQVKLNY